MPANATDKVLKRKWTEGRSLIMAGIMTLMLALLSLGAAAQELKPDTNASEVAEALLPDSATTATLAVMADSAAHKAAQQVTVQTAKPHFIPNPKRALWFSLIPGGGQVYNRKYWKLPIVYGGFFGCIYALNWNNRMYQDYQQAYIDIMDDDPDTHSYLEMLPINYDITGKEDRFKDIFRRKKDYYRRYRDLSIFIMVGVWALAAIDAYVDAELSTFDISKDLTLRLAPAVFPADRAQLQPSRRVGGGVQMSLTF